MIINPAPYCFLPDIRDKVMLETLFDEFKKDATLLAFESLQRDWQEYYEDEDAEFEEDMRMMRHEMPILREMALQDAFFAQLKSKNRVEQRRRHKFGRRSRPHRLRYEKHFDRIESFGETRDLKALSYDLRDVVFSKTIDPPKDLIPPKIIAVSCGKDSGEVYYTDGTDDVLYAN